MSGGKIWGRGRHCAWATIGGRRQTDLGSVGAVVPGCYRLVMVEVSGGAKMEILSRKERKMEAEGLVFCLAG